MIRMFAPEGVIRFQEHDQATALLKPDSYIPGATTFEAAPPAGQFLLQTYSQPNYTIYKSTFIPARDQVLRVEYGTQFLGFRIMIDNHIRYQLNGSRFYLMQGQVNMVVAPWVNSEMQLRKNELYVAFDLQIDPQWFAKLKINHPAIFEIAEGIGTNQTIILHGGPGFASIRVLDRMEDLLRDPGNESLVEDLIREVVEARAVKQSHRQISELQIESLFRVKAEIKKHLASRQQLRYWARSAGMNITYFKELFKTVFGITPYHYLLYERIREAKRLMQFYPHLTLSEVAVACGFTNYNNLRRAFYALENVTLSQWQRLSNITCLLVSIGVGCILKGGIA